MRLWEDYWRFIHAQNAFTSRTSRGIGSGVCFRLLEQLDGRIARPGDAHSARTRRHRLDRRAGRATSKPSSARLARREASAYTLRCESPGQRGRDVRSEDAKPVAGGVDFRRYELSRG